MRWFRFVAFVQTFKVRALAPDQEHEALARHPLYRQALEDGALGDCESGVLALKRLATARKLALWGGRLVSTASIAIVVLKLLDIQLFPTFVGLVAILALSSIPLGLLLLLTSKLMERFTAVDLANHDLQVRRYIASRSPKEVAQHIRNDFVLYLRSFDADAVAAQRQGWMTEEEQLVEALAQIGPVVAVGRPGEPLPQAGATRMYMQESDWRERVAKLVDTAALVVLRVGTTRGLMWEAEYIARNARPGRVLLLGDSRVDTLRFINLLLSHAGLPEKRFLLLRGRRIGSTKAIVAFGDDWSVRVLRCHSGTFRILQRNRPLVGRFVLSLEPVIRSLQKTYNKPGLEEASVFLLLLSPILAFFAVGIVYVIYVLVMRLVVP